MRTLTSLFAAVLVSAPAFAQVGVSVTYGEPGFYGRIDLYDAPRPRLIYPEPVIIVHSQVVGPPIYLHVPPAHAHNWAHHCAAYGACGHRVYFVQDVWYRDVYVPHYHKHHKGKGKGHKKGHGKGHKDHD
jgi:hypothetical protein